MFRRGKTLVFIKQWPPKEGRQNGQLSFKNPVVHVMVVHWLFNGHLMVNQWLFKGHLMVL